jgi:CBS domain-containing protein
MPIADVMSLKVVSVTPADTVQDAIGRMLAANVGAVAVCEGTRLVGIFTERDVLRLAGEQAALPGIRVGDVMTRDVLTVSGDVEILDAARVMGERRIRHLPVVEGENLLGVVGIRDVLGALAERLWRSHDEEARKTVHDLLARLPRPR